MMLLSGRAWKDHTHENSGHPGDIRRFYYVHQLTGVIYWFATSFRKITVDITVSVNG